VYFFKKCLLLVVTFNYKCHY